MASINPNDYNPFNSDNVDKAKKVTSDLIDTGKEQASKLANAGQQTLADGSAFVSKSAIGGFQGLQDFLFETLPGKGFPIPDAAEIAKDPIGTIIDILPPIFSFPGFPFPQPPKLDDGMPSLEGLDPMTALMVIQSYIEQKSGDVVQLLGTLTQVQASLQEAQALDLAKGIDPNDSKSATSKAKAEVMDKFGDDLGALGIDSKGNLDLGQVSTAINMLTMQVQKMESFRQQLNTMASNLLKSDHEAKMVTLRNIPTR